jgi:hypothetical protein
MLVELKFHSGFPFGSESDLRPIFGGRIAEACDFHFLHLRKFLAEEPLFGLVHKISTWCVQRISRTVLPSVLLSLPKSLLRQRKATTVDASLLTWEPRPGILQRSASASREFGEYFVVW